MIQVNLVYKHDVIKRKIAQHFPELILIEEDLLKIVYDTDDDNKYIDLVKKFIKQSREFAGLYISVTKKL